MAHRWLLPMLLLLWLCSLGHAATIIQPPPGTGGGAPITNYNPELTSNQALNETGGPTGSSVGLMSCEASEVLQRNITNTGWECASADALATYLSGVTANQGLSATGGAAGATVGLMDCAANQILQRNAGDTAWVCAAAGGVSDYIASVT